MRDLLRPESDCPGFALRRLHAGDLEGEEAARVRAHVDACTRCTAAWKRLDEERAALPAIESFRVGVVRHTERLQSEQKPARKRTPWIPMALAASLAIVAAVPLLLREPAPTATERVKGGAGLDVLVGGTAEPRLARDGEKLHGGESVRLQLQTGTHRWALALSVDDAGEVSTLYDDAGTSLAVHPGESTLLPDAIAFEGQGAERIYVFLSDRPLSTDEVARSLKAAHRRAGSARAMGDLDGVPGVQSHRLVIKP